MKSKPKLRDCLKLYFIIQSTKIPVSEKKSNDLDLNMFKITHTLTNLINYTIAFGKYLRNEFFSVIHLKAIQLWLG